VERDTFHTAQRASFGRCSFPALAAADGSAELAKAIWSAPASAHAIHGGKAAALGRPAQCGSLPMDEGHALVSEAAFAGVSIGYG
jgi:hypothetical protein